MRNLLVILTVLTILSLQNFAQADYATTPQPYPNHAVPNLPYPHYGTYPYPAPVNHYPAPGYYPQGGLVTCFAVGLNNGALFYGTGFNVYAAQQWAMYACNSSGQYCQITGCQY